jgi:predicted aminopeptidase
MANGPMGAPRAGDIDVKAAKAREAFRRLIVEMRADGRPSYACNAADLEEAVGEAADTTLAKLYDFFRKGP